MIAAADLVRLALVPPFLLGLWIILRRRERKVGRTLMLIGAVHGLGGILVGWRPLVRIFERGFLGEGDSTIGHLPSRTDQETVFWFLLWGVMAFLLGQAVAHMEDLGRRLPPRLGWGLAAMSLAAIVLAPKGGFWWVLLPAYWIVRGPGRRENDV